MLTVHLLFFSWIAFCRHDPEHCLERRRKGYAMGKKKRSQVVLEDWMDESITRSFGQLHGYHFKTL
jgi:hypothetical protein